MKCSFAIATFVLAALFSSVAHAQGPGVTDPSFRSTLPERTPVQVEWEDPDGFTEIRFSRNRFEARRGNWVRRLAEHLQQEAAHALGPGERMELLITDIDRAGEYEPVGAGMRDVRVVRDLYPPMMQVSFVRRGADGQVMQQGNRTLSDLGFLSATPRSTNDPLRFEKRMIEDWVRREFQSTPDSHDRR